MCVAILIGLVQLPAVNRHIALVVLSFRKEPRELVGIDVDTEHGFRVDDFGFYLEAIGENFGVFHSVIIGFKLEQI